MKTLILFCLSCWPFSLNAQVDESSYEINFTSKDMTWIKAHPKLNYSGDPFWEPLSFYHNDLYQGLIVDYMEEISKRTGIALTPIKQATWQNTITALDEQSIAFIDAMTPSQERLKKFAFTAPFLSLDIVMVTRNDIKFIGDMEDLAKKKIGTTQGYVTIDYLAQDHPAWKVSQFATVSKGLLALLNKEVDVYITDLPSFSHYSELLGIRDLKISGITPYKFNLGIALPKDQTELLGIFNQAISSFSHREKSALFRRWVPLAYAEKTNYTLLLRVGGSFLITLLLILLWLNQVQKQKVALQNSKERFSLAMDIASEGLFEWRPNTFYFSPRFTTMLGYDHGELPVKLETWKDLIHPEDLEEAWHTISQTMEGTLQGFEIEYRMRSKNGIYRHILCKAQLISNQDYHSESRFIGTNTDIEFLKQNEIELQRAKSLAESANRAKSEFLANMSHEIRTPMNAVLGFTELLKNNVVEPKNKSYLSSIDSAGKSLLRLINDILDLSKVEAGKFELEYKAVSPRELFSEMRSIFKQKISSKGLEFLFEIDDKVPKALILDETRIRQILFNLIGNAIKFTHQGYIKLTVLCEINPNDPEYYSLCFSVEDSGIGISSENKDSIFDAFEQQKGQSHIQYGGTGLGLAISKKLVALMKGDMQLNESPSGGCIFTVTIDEVLGAVLDASTNSKLLCNVQSFHEAKALIVDDISLNRELLVDFLTPYHLLCETACNGQEALEKIANDKPDIILMDMKMPIMNGYEATHLLKSNESTQDIPIIAVTASSMVETEEEIRAICDSFLHKPVSQVQIINEISRFIEWQPIPTLDDIVPETELEDVGHMIKYEIPQKLQEKIYAYLNTPNTAELTLIIEQLRAMGEESRSSRYFQ